MPNDDEIESVSKVYRVVEIKTKPEANCLSNV